jgi:putative nucleotidyltransferase with HDIG domain
VSKISKSSYARIVDTPKIVRWLVMISFTGSLLIGIAFLAANGWQETSASLFLMGFLSLSLFIVERWGYPQIAALFLYLLVSSILSFNVSIGHGIFDEAMLVFPLLIVFSGLIFGKRSVVLVTGITLAQFSLVYSLSVTGQVQPFEGAVNMSFEDMVTTLIILLATGFLIWVVIDIIENAVLRISRSEQEVEEAYDQTLMAWARALELRNREEPGHSARVSSLTVLFAEEIGLSEEQVRGAWQGALLHDIGKMGVPESILLKAEAFSPAEQEIIKEHPRMGCQLFEDVTYLKGAMNIIAHHHERYDGQGFPGHLSGDDVPYEAQLFSIVDCWDMLRTERPCREAFSNQEALNFIKEQSGKKFHPELVAKFLDLVEKFGLEHE